MSEKVKIDLHEASLLTDEPKIKYDWQDFTGEYYPHELRDGVRYIAKQIAHDTVVEMRKVPKRVLMESQILQEQVGSLGEQIFYHVFLAVDPNMKQKVVLPGYGKPNGDFTCLGHTVEVKSSTYDGHLLLKTDRPIDSEYYVFCWIDKSNKWGILRGFCTAKELVQSEVKEFGEYEDCCYGIHKSRLHPMSQFVTLLQEVKK